MNETLTLRAAVIDLAMPALRMHESYARQLVDDLDEGSMDEMPAAGLENTPRFTLGHLCMASALTVWVLQHPEEGYDELVLDVPAGYPALFQRTGPGDRRLPETGRNAPSKEALLDELRRQHDRVLGQIDETPEEVLALRRTWKLSHHLPRIADIVMFQCLHEMLHLGQLAAWRRAKGLPAAMARMAELRV